VNPNNRTDIANNITKNIDFIYLQVLGAEYYSFLFIKYKNGIYHINRIDNNHSLSG